ncbi:MAG: IMP dehydrogenase, partial [Candidatus Omnitrophica bacterium]|nr:IMP dehydrogenase [Candidatus Omnitrophota bacterium]
MGEWIGKDRKARRCYGFDEIALVPSTVTINPDEVDISWEINGRKFSIPFLASAMDGVVDPKFAVAMGKLGAIAVLNLEGIYTRYDDYEPILDDIAKASPEKATELVQKLYLK